MEKSSPALYLIPCTLGATPIEQVLPAYNKEVILSIRHFIVEESTPRSIGLLLI